MAVPRSCSGLFSAGVARNYWLISGEALHNTQFLPSSLIAIDDCVRAEVCIVPLRTPAQFGQLQFHWGKPPPAAEPKTVISICVNR